MFENNYTKIFWADSTCLLRIFIKCKGVSQLNLAIDSVKTSKTEYDKCCANLKNMIDKKNGITQSDYLEYIDLLNCHKIEKHIIFDDMNENQDILKLIQNNKTKEPHSILITSDKHLIDKANQVNVAIWNPEDRALVI